MSPYPGLRHLRLAGLRRRRSRSSWGAAQLGRPTPRPAPASRSASAPANTADARRELERFTPDRRQRRRRPGQLALRPVPRRADHERPGQHADPQRRDDRLHGRQRTPRPPRSSSAARLPNATGVAAGRQRLRPVQRADGPRHDRLLELPPARPGRRLRRARERDLLGIHGDARPDADLRPAPSTR